MYQGGIYPPGSSNHSTTPGRIGSGLRGCRCFAVVVASGSTAGSTWSRCPSSHAAGTHVHAKRLLQSRPPQKIPGREPATQRSPQSSKVKRNGFTQHEKSTKDTKENKQPRMAADIRGSE